MSRVSETIRYIVRQAGHHTSDWLGRVLAFPDTVLLRSKDEHAVLRMSRRTAELVQRELPELTIEEDVRHRMVAG